MQLGLQDCTVGCLPFYKFGEFDILVKCMGTLQWI